MTEGSACTATTTTLHPVRKVNNPMQDNMGKDEGLKT